MTYVQYASDARASTSRAGSRPGGVTNRAASEESVETATTSSDSATYRGPKASGSAAMHPSPLGATDAVVYTP